jgi:hypothetical protein
MAKSKLYNVAVLFHPALTKDTAGNPIEKKSEIVIAPKYILAIADEHARILLGREIPEKYIDKMFELEFIVRPL